MNKKLKFRDEQVAEDVAKKAALGWLETEILVYGCAYLDSKSDKVFYKISTCEDDIYQFIEVSKLYGFFPSQVMTLKRRYEIPTGMKEIAGKMVKVELAQLLRSAYPKAFFYTLHQLAGQCASNEVAEALWHETTCYENSLDEMWLYRIKLLIEYAFFCQGITLETYKQLQCWLSNEQKYLGETIVNKQRFQKVVYGFGYKSNGVLQYFVDTQKNAIYRKMYSLEAKGYVVGPIFSKRYWYCLCDDLANVIQSFKLELKDVCNLEYMNKIIALRQKKIEANDFQLETQVTAVRNLYGDEAANTLFCYGNRWGLLG